MIDMIDRTEILKKIFADLSELTDYVCIFSVDHLVLTNPRVEYALLFKHSNASVRLAGFKGEFFSEEEQTNLLDAIDACIARQDELKAEEVEKQTRIDNEALLDRLFPSLIKPGPVLAQDELIDRNLAPL